MLDEIIKNVLKDSKTLKNIEKLNYITKYNPYYKEPKFYEKVDSDIFNSFDLNEIDDLNLTKCPLIEDESKVKYIQCNNI